MDYIVLFLLLFFINLPKFIIPELELARGFISPQTFPLSSKLAGRLRAISCAVHNGRGFEVLRGLQPSRFSEEDLVIIYVGITSYVADKRVGVMSSSTGGAGPPLAVATWYTDR